MHACACGTLEAPEAPVCTILNPYGAKCTSKRYKAGTWKRSLLNLGKSSAVYRVMNVYPVSPESCYNDQYRNTPEAVCHSGLPRE